MNKTLWNCHFSERITMGIALGRKEWLLCLALFSAVAAGCTPIPTGRFDLLAESGDSALKGATTVFSQVENLQLVDCVARARTKPLAEDVFKPEGLDLTPRLNLRHSAIQVLDHYLALLKDLAEKNFQGDIDAASDKLAASVKTLTTQLAPQNDKLSQAGGILATLVDAIGTEVIREKRINALEKVMTSAQEHLLHVCSLLSNDVEEIKQFVLLMKKRIYSNYQAVRPPQNEWARLAADRELAQVLRNVDDANAGLEALGKAVAKIPPAHEETLKALRTPEKPTDALKSLITEGQRLAKFYQGVK